MREVNPYVYRESRDCFLPRDVLDSLGEPQHVKQGNLVIFATSATAAGRIMLSLQLTSNALSTARRLCPGQGREVLELGTHPSGTVLAFSQNSGPRTVVRVDGPGPGKQGRQVITRIGELRSGIFYPGDVDDIEVTDAMVHAAYDAISDAAKAKLAAFFDRNERLNYDQDCIEYMRAGIAAALRLYREKS